MPVKVLVVDDSIVVRRLVTTALQENEDIEIVGSASNGKLAIDQAEKLEPDVITLDIEMPEMNGLEALKILRKRFPKIAVVMFSTLTQHGAKVTVEALTIGAADYVTKPANVGSVQESVNVLREELVPKVIALGCNSSVERSGMGKASSQIAQLAGMGVQKAAIGTQFAGAQRPTITPTEVQAVVIGVSTGGPDALAKLMPTIPKHFAVPICIVQHMPPVFTRLLAERLNQESEIDVVEGAPGMTLEPGKAIIAPGDFHMELRRLGSRSVVSLNQHDKENSCRPAVDVLFRSASNLFKNKVIGVVLTGMGQDGLLGTDVLRNNGGYTIAQDKETSVVWGMPGAVASANLADEILPIEQIGGRLSTLTGSVSASRTKVNQ